MSVRRRKLMAKRASPGEGRPYQRKEDGRWVVVVRDVDGRRRYLYAPLRPEVVAKRDDWNTAIRTGLTPSTGRLTVERQLDDWLDDRRGKVRPSTWIDYEAHVRIHLASLAKIQLVKLTPNDVRRLLRERAEVGCSPSLIGKSLTVLRMALGQAQDDGLVPRNVARRVQPPDIVRDELAILTPLQCRRFLAAARDDDELAALWPLMLGTGMRLGEALGLRRPNIDLNARELMIVRALRPIDRRVRAEGEPRLQLVELKTDAARRTIGIPQLAAEPLARHLDATEGAIRNVKGYVFTTSEGTPHDPRNVDRRFKAVLARARLPKSRIHDLRHTAASLMLAQGAGLHDVMKTLGHSSITMTANTYGHLVVGRSVELADGMDRIIGAIG
jgi:integrase